MEDSPPIDGVFLERFMANFIRRRKSCVVGYSWLLMQHIASMGKSSGQLLNYHILSKVIRQRSKLILINSLLRCHIKPQVKTTEINVYP